MFGYIAANVESLSEAEKARYHDLYCGLCRALKEQHGQPSRATLTYDLTFLIMLFGSLYEPAEESGSQRCPVHPLKTQDFARHTYTTYAADMTVALAYHKCLDDWHDDNKATARGFGHLLEPTYRTVSKRWPRQCAAMEQELAHIHNIEQAEDAPPDAAANHFGRLMGEIFVIEDDQWAPELRRFGAQLGRFVYFMDAAIDYDDDLEHHSYNPFVKLEATPETREAVLTRIMGDATTIFEKLPLEQDLHIMRSVLYAGVWQQFYKLYKADKAADQKDTDE